jgi:hypothetical protein
MFVDSRRTDGLYLHERYKSDAKIKVMQLNSEHTSGEKKLGRRVTALDAGKRCRDVADAK